MSETKIGVEKNTVSRPTYSLITDRNTVIRICHPIEASVSGCTLKQPDAKQIALGMGWTVKGVAYSVSGFRVGKINGQRLGLYSE